MTDAPDDLRLEQAILALLAQKQEIYPSHMIGLLRAQDASLPLTRTRDVLERLFAQRRVARLWHRYLLARDVDAVRAKWLGMIARLGDQLDSTMHRGAARDGHAILTSWDGWKLQGLLAETSA